MFESIKKAMGHEDPEVFAQRYMDQMDARIRTNTEAGLGMRTVYSIEMQALEQLKENIATPPASVWKKNNYRDRRIHALNKIVKKYKDTFSREYGDEFNEAILMDAKLQTESKEGRSRFLSDMEEHGISEVIGSDSTSRGKFVGGLNYNGLKMVYSTYKDDQRNLCSPVGTEEHPPIFKLEEKVEKHFKDEARDNISKVDTAEDSVYHDIADAISQFSIESLIPDPTNMDNDHKNLLDFNLNFNKFLFLMKAADTDLNPEKWGPELYSFIMPEIKNKLSADKSNPIVTILASGTNGWKFMSYKHPHMLIEYAANDMFQKLDEICKNILSSGDITQLNNTEYLKLVAIRRTLSRVMSEVILKHQEQETDKNDVSNLLIDFGRYTTCFANAGTRYETVCAATFAEIRNLSSKKDKLLRKYKEDPSPKIQEEIEKLDQQIALYKENFDKLNFTGERNTKGELNTEEKLYNKDKYNQTKKSVIHQFNYDYYYSLLSQKDLEGLCPALEKLNKSTITPQRRSNFIEVKYVPWRSYKKYLNLENKERIASDNSYIKQLGDRLVEALCKGKVPLEGNPITLKLVKLAEFCSNEKPEDRMKSLKEIFDDDGKRFTINDIKKSNKKNNLNDITKNSYLREFLKLTWSGTDLFGTMDNTGLGYLCQNYPGLLVKITLEILLDELAGSDKLSKNFEDLLLMRRNENCLTTMNRKVTLKCMEKISTDYNKVLHAAAKSNGVYYANYLSWKNFEKFIPKMHEDLVNLCSNDIDTLTQLCKKYKDEDILKENIDYRKKCIEKINHIAEYPEKKSDKKEKQKEEKIEKGGSHFKTAYHLKNFDHADHPVGGESYENWAVALADMIRFKGTGKGPEADDYLRKNLDKNIIESYRAVPLSYGYNKYNVEDKTLDEINMKIPSEIGHHMNLIAKILPNAALRKTSFQTGKDKIDINTLKNYIGNKIRTTIIDQQAPLCYCFENKCWIITGMENGEVYYYPTSTYKQQKIKLKDLEKNFMELVSNNNKVDFYWLTDVTPEFEESCKNPNGVFRQKGSVFKNTLKIEFATTPIGDHYKHENYNAFKVEGSSVESLSGFGAHLKGKEEFIYLPKRENSEK